MQRGLFYQLGPPSPAAYQALRDEVRLAEALGLDRVFCLPRTDEEGGFSGGSAAVWLAALAAETERVRLGWGVPGLFPPSEPPVREAEQAATLDVAAGGRLDVALLPGRGVTARGESTAALGGEASDASRDSTADDAPENAAASRTEQDTEGVRMLVDMWAPATFSWTSARFAVPPIDVVPKPVQRPHPPVWLVGWNADQASAAGRAGMAFLDVSGGGEAVWRAHRALFAEARAEAAVDALVAAGEFAIAVDLEAGSEAALGGSGAGGWLAGFEALEADAVILCAGPLEGGHEEACRRIRWLAAG